MNTTIIGDGGWGTALALVLSNNGHNVRAWGPFAENIASIQANGCNEAFLPGVSLPDTITWTADPEAAVKHADLVVLAIPTQFFRAVTERFRHCMPPAATVVSVTKGLDRETHQTMTAVAAQTLACEHVAALSGPSHAEEVARGIPTAVVSAAQQETDRAKVQAAFNGNAFRVYTSDDVTGVQIGGALKNVIAIAVGISDGLGFGDNTRAALITRGLVEISRLGAALHCQPATFAGLSGMGDLIVTCTSRHSRNRGVGERIGRGETLAQITSGMRQVAEGVWNCDNALALAREHGVDLPITQLVHQILHGQIAPQLAVETLMARDTKPE
ncbi:MAG: NAD(P)H-dependent glycerol-3-phosphate dehydrogenase [Kiritimatiellia bacterium]